MVLFIYILKILDIFLLLCNKNFYILKIIVILTLIENEKAILKMKHDTPKQIL